VIRAFDAYQYDAIRAMLPLEVELPEAPAQTPAQ
jgi:hypothetical protein